jgi:hypothetical protein
MPNGDIVLAPPEIRSVMQSNMPAEHKTTAIRAWYDKAMSKVENAAKQPVLTVAEEGGNLVLGNLVGALTGAVMGYAESRLGSLDLGKRKDIPIDGAAAGVGAIAALLLAGHPSGASAVARYASVASTAVYTQRKTKEHFDSHSGSPASMHGESRESPLLEHAKNL